MQNVPVSHMTRKPRRFTLTVSDKTYQQLIARSDLEGRSLSNLGAFLLEMALEERMPPSQGLLSRAWSSETRA